MGNSEPFSVPRDHLGRIVLGIDPGTRVLGYGALVMRRSGVALVAAGSIKPQRRLSVPERLGYLRQELDALLPRLRPSVVVLEQAFLGRNAQSTLRLGEARGVVLASVCAYKGQEGQEGPEIQQYSPAHIKRCLAGNGRAGKDKVAQIVEHQLALQNKIKEYDVSDALAAALAYVSEARFQEKMV